MTQTIPEVRVEKHRETYPDWYHDGIALAAHNAAVIGGWFDNRADIAKEKRNWFVRFGRKAYRDHQARINQVVKDV